MLSRRERQIMDAVYAAGPLTAAEVQAAIPDPPGYSAVRALLRILEGKGHLKHTEVGGKYVFAPTRHRGSAARGALRRVLSTFFDNSAAKAVAALLDLTDTDVSPAEVAELSELIEKVKKKGAKP
jgi:predicted transcriptional regulator